MEKGKRSKVFAVTIAMVLFLVCVVPAHAVTVRLSGQINRAIMWADNGKNSELFHVDNDNSSTRFRWTGEETFSNNITVGVVWESQFISNSSANVDIGQRSDGDASFSERKLEAWFDTDYGKLWIGQGDGAANDTSETDLSGTGVIMYSAIADTAGGLTFRTSDGQVGPSIGDTRSNFDGLSRNDRLRYDTPVFGGFHFSASATNGDAWELATRWAQQYDGLGKFAAALGYVDSALRTEPRFQQIGISGSWLHTSGLNVTLAWGNRDYDDSTQVPQDSNRDATNYYAKFGYTVGMHALAFEIGQTEDLAQDGDEANNWGLGYVITPWNGVEFYSLLRSFSLDRNGVDYEDISQIMVGTRVKF